MKAFDFKLPDQNGKMHALNNYLGSWIVLYFYPKDNTPGCTKEACSFRDNMDNLVGKNVVVLGISKDSVDSHKKFSDKFKLNFSLLSDESKEVIKKYSAWGKKKFMGKEFEGVLRITYIINPQGEIVKKYDKVNPLFHTNEVKKDLEEMKKSA